MVRDRKLFGVCGGLAQYFGVDVSVVRVLVFLAAVASFGIAAMVYLVAAIVIDENDQNFGELVG